MAAMTPRPARIHLVAAARPNFMKVGPLFHALRAEAWAEPRLIHTGQHYDASLSGVFFRDFDLPPPHRNLGVGSGSHAEQTGRVMMAYEALLGEERPAVTVVVGDVNSTLACSLAAAKLGVPVAHLEAGLRSFDRTMPEEINRVVTDAVADILWTPSPDADANLAREGVDAAKVLRVGNIMIDTLERLRPRIDAVRPEQAFGLPRGGFGLVTLHRPSNVDDPERLAGICAALTRLSARLPLLFPLHPRTRARLEAFGLMERLTGLPSLVLAEPLPYIDFMGALFASRFALTDSGGLQEETTYLGIPCLTLRPNTERPITVSEGTNRLVTPQTLEEQAHAALDRPPGKRAPELWDGRTAPRVVASLARFVAGNGV